MKPQLDLSVVIPTHNRADLLRRALESYARQSLSQDDYEIIVADDRSTDHTASVCRELASEIVLSYIRSGRDGSSAAKNAGLAAASGRLILFADDDDIADRHLLSAHIAAHAEHPEPNVAILGYTTWHPGLTITPLMHYVTEVGQFLFSYPQLRHGDVLDFRYLWGGRTSVKRAPLVEEGGFEEGFCYMLEDIELGYRWSERGLRIVFDRRPVTFMARPVDYDGFAARCEQLGASLARLRRLHPTPAIDAYAQTILRDSARLLDRDPRPELKDAEGSLDRLKPRIRELEQRLSQERDGARFHIRGAAGWARWRRAKRELHRLYSRAFRAATLKGALSTMIEQTA